MKFFLILFSILTFAQQKPKVDFISTNAILKIDVTKKSISGSVEYDFTVNSVIDTIKIDAIKMNFSEVFINGKQIKYKNTNKQLLLFEGFKTGKNTLKFQYSATPKQTLYFTGSQNTNNLQIWTQGQGKYTSNWFPSFDDVNEKLIFNLSVVFDKNFLVISNGILSKKSDFSNSENIWNYKMKKPMSSYLLMLAIGKFNKKTQISNSGISLENYLQPKDESKFETTYKQSKEIFDFLESEIGVKYPWEIYRQIPVEDFLYAGMENTSSTLFAQDFVADESGFNDKNYINVNAHELAHQWFGDLITAKSGKHHWLQEGFATYYASLAERKLFGEDYFYYQLYKNALQVKQAAKTDTIPLQNEKASALSFYQKGALALHTIRESIGEKLFKKAVKNYLNKYKFKNVESKDFLYEVKNVSNFDIYTFEKNWLQDYHYQSDEMNVLLTKSEFIRKLIEIQSRKKLSFTENKPYFEEILKSNVYFPLKTEIIYQIKNIPFQEKENLIKFAMQTNDFEVRQAVAITVSKIPESFKFDYEQLLFDKSYDTKEIAFRNLMQSFPDDEVAYLSEAKQWESPNDKSLQILFLSYAQKCKAYSEVERAEFLNELLDYSSPKFESSVRQNAFENLFLFESKNRIMLKNLVNATLHHKWQFVKFSKDKIRNLLKSEEYRTLFTELLSELDEPEKVQLQKFLDEKVVK